MGLSLLLHGTIWWAERCTYTLGVVGCHRSTDPCLTMGVINMRVDSRSNPNRTRSSLHSFNYSLWYLQSMSIVPSSWSSCILCCLSLGCSGYWVCSLWSVACKSPTCLNSVWLLTYCSTSRRLKLGKWSRLAIEDYLMVFALVSMSTLHQPSMLTINRSTLQVLSSLLTKSQRMARITCRQKTQPSSHQKGRARPSLEAKWHLFSRSLLSQPVGRSKLVCSFSTDD